LKFPSGGIHAEHISVNFLLIREWLHSWFVESVAGH